MWSGVLPSVGMSADTPATTDGLENTMLERRSRSPKSTYHIISFTPNVQNRRIERERKWINGYLRLRNGVGEAIAKGLGFSF